MMSIGVARMDRELINNIALFIIAVIAGAVGYFRRRPTNPDPIMSVGLGWMEREQTERMLKALDNQAIALTRIADALVMITDHRTNNMAERMDELMEKIELLSTPPSRRPVIKKR